MDLNAANHNSHKINRVCFVMWTNHFINRKNPEVKNRKNPLALYW